MHASDNITSLTGRLLGGRYRLLRLIKAGGMGAVYEARDLKLERPVAVKVLKPELSQQPEMVRRLFREARAASQIRSPHIVEYLDYDQIAGGPAYLVMELLEGVDLEHVLRQRGPLPWKDVAGWIREACRALGVAHAAGIIHRDIKPSNFVLVERPRAGEASLKLIDFGIVKLTHSSSLSGDTEMTQHLLGTEVFMAPELFAGATPNPRTEMYALGVSIYRLLTGKYPRSDTYAPPPPSAIRGGVSPGVDALVARCLAIDPALRYQTMGDLDAALVETLDETETVPRRPPARASPGALASNPAPRRRSPLVLGVGASLLVCASALAWSLSASPEHADTPPAPAELREAVREPTPAPDAPATPPRPTPTSPRPLEPAAAPQPDAPAPFSRRAAQRVLAAEAARARACGRAAKLLPGMTASARLRITIRPDGTAEARPLQLGSLDHVQCAAKLVESLRFPASVDGGAFDHEFKM